MGPRIECPSCSSKNQQLFAGEVAIHFPGRDGLNKPIVWVFPKLSVCIDCGVAQFSIPEKELQVLVTGAQVDGTVVSEAA
jgi:hypothetical protein